MSDELERLMREATAIEGWKVVSEDFATETAFINVQHEPGGAFDFTDAALIVAAVNALPELLERVKRLEEIEKCARYVDDALTVGDKSMRLGELLRLCRARAALATTKESQT